MSRYGHEHSPHDEDGITFEDPWLWDLTPQEIADRWRQSSGEDPMPK